MKEIILDTNVIAHYLLADVPQQFEEAKKLFTKIKKHEVRGLISILVLDELIWVLENYYSLKRKDYIPSIVQVLSQKDIRIIEAKKEIIVTVLEKMKERTIDFTDFYLAEISSGRTIFSFDKDFEKMKK